MYSVLTFTPILSVSNIITDITYYTINVYDLLLIKIRSSYRITNIKINYS